MNNKFKENDTVYIIYITDSANRICKSKVKSVLHDNIVKVGFKSFVDKKGEETDCFAEISAFRFIDRSSEFNGVWHTANEAFVVMNKHNEWLKQYYLNMMKTAEEFARFPLSHNLNGDSADVMAIEAYKEKAKEILNVEIDIL